MNSLNIYASAFLLTLSVNLSALCSLLPDSSLGPSSMMMTTAIEPGESDPTFGIRGKVTTALGSNSTEAINSVAIQTDGKAVAVGYRNVNNTVPHTVIARYTPDGLLDTNFGSSGVLLLQLSSSSSDEAKSVAIQGDGKIVVGGYAYTGDITRGDFYVLRLNEDGSFDQSFGINGKVFTDFNTLNDLAYALIIQPDGKIVLGGQSATPNSRFNFALVRYNSNGALDLGFGNGGKVDGGTPTFESQISSIKLQADGKIVGAGRRDNGTGTDTTVLRYNSDGSPDTSFDGDGMVITSMLRSSRATSVDIQFDGKIVVMGKATVGQLDDFLVIRYETNGSLDAGFDGDGIVTTDIGGTNDETFDGIIQPDGKILSIGTNAFQIVMVRYNPDGSLDTSFNNTGIVVTSVGTVQDFAYAGALLDDGRILVGGSSVDGTSGVDLALVRYNSNGSPDLSFGPPGFVATAFQTTSDSANALAIQSDGMIVAVGRSRNNFSLLDDLAIARYKADGSLDPTFALGGRGVISLSAGHDDANKVAIQPDGKIVAVGFAGTAPNSDFAILRFNTDGYLDTSFGSGGRVILPVGSAQDTAYDLAIQSDGKILIAGVATVNSSVDFAVVRLNVNGSKDLSFDTDGIVTTPISSGEDVARAIKIQPDGSFVVAGYTTPTGSNSDFAAVRFLTNGSLDATFGTGGKITTPIGTGDDKAFSMTLQTDGKAIVVGSTVGTGGQDFALVRYNLNGSLDTSFDNDGIVITTVLPDSIETANDVVIQKNGKILIGGTTNFNDSGLTGSNVGLARYNSNGSLDNTFSSDGIVVTNLGNRGEVIRSLALQRDGKIVAAGTINGISTTYFMVLRYGGDNISLTPSDFDGDGKTDLSIFRPNAPGGGEWWWLKSSTGGNAALQFGTATDHLVPSDYTGDGKTDVAFWRLATGQWFVLRSEDFSFYAFPFGATGDVPVPADYDGDRKADAAVFRESSLTWFISKSSGGTDIVGFGAAGDKPVNADYDGDAKADIAIFRPSGATGAEWWIRRSSNGGVFATQFGTATDKPVAGDYTGDGKADIAFWTPSSGTWFVLRSDDFSYYAFPFGSSADVPVPGDYDGDGKLDAAVFRPSTSTWFANRSTAGVLIQQFGSAGDLPVPAAFVR